MRRSATPRTRWNEGRERPASASHRAVASCRARRALPFVARVSAQLAPPSPSWRAAAGAHPVRTAARPSTTRSPFPPAPRPTHATPRPARASSARRAPASSAGAPTRAPSRTATNPRAWGPWTAALTDATLHRPPRRRLVSRRSHPPRRRFPRHTAQEWCRYPHREGTIRRRVPCSDKCMRPESSPALGTSLDP